MASGGRTRVTKILRAVLTGRGRSATPGPTSPKEAICRPPDLATLLRHRHVPEPQPYLPTFQVDGGGFINAAHRDWHEGRRVPGKQHIVHRIEGKLLPADAAKIYELAFFSRGPTADIGTNKGLSAFVAASALRDSGSGYAVHTVDMNADLVEQARRNHAVHGSPGNVTFHCGEAAEWLARRRDERARFGFAFVDHSHHYEPVRAICALLPEVLLPGAFVAFHDFLDGRNNNPKSAYDVARAVLDTLKEPPFRIYGAFGCTGVFRFMPNDQPDIA